MKYLTLILFFSISTIILAQKTQSKTNQDDSEKKKLENKSKALSSFYIDNTGLVVYSQETNNTQTALQKNKSVAKTAPISNNNVIVISDSKNKNEKGSSSKKEATVLPNANIVVIDKQPIIAPKTKHELVSLNENNSDSVEEVYVDDDVNYISSKVKPQGSIFGRKRKSEYKNMEEAALAVESLISDLKKEQSTKRSSGSMSSRLSRGVTKDLRKNTISKNQSTNPLTSSNVQSAQDEDYGLEPSYFINGVQVDKIEVNKLLKSDIINREIRTRNTVTNNPNGEIWYKVKIAPKM